jgi:uncharacterized membrane protein
MKKKILITLLLLGFMWTGSATIIAQENISNDLETNKVNVNAEVESLTTETFNWRTSNSVSNLKAKIDGKDKKCEIENLAVGSLIECPSKKRENFTVELNYVTERMTNELDNAVNFRYSQPIYRPIKNYSFEVILPEGTGVLDPEKTTREVISPNTGRVENKEGRRFVVKWNTNPTLREPESFSVIYEPFSDTETQIIDPKLILGIISTLIIISLIIYKLRTNKNDEENLEDLNEDEKEVIEILKDNNGEILQKDIVNETEYSKAKISEVISSLEEHQMISKEKDGRSNKICLIKAN